ncbi:MAG: pectate lyase [Pseudomonadota bacterium]
MRVFGSSSRAATVAAAVLGLTGAAAEPQFAFAGAEGAGRFAAGGRGGTVIHVTTLADAGPGSLRAAVDTPGPRVVVFDVTGTIRLASPLTIDHGRITIAGQSAPGGGITIADHGLVVEADDVIVRYIRSRMGDRAGVEGDAIWLARGSRIILDHVSASWSTDETLSVSARYDAPGDGLYDVSVQWSIIAQSLRRSVHAKGEHGYGSLVRGGRGARFSFHHNLWAHHVARMPRPGNYASRTVDPVGPVIEFRSNVFYNWGGAASGYNADTASAAAYNFIDNAYLTGPDSKAPLAFEESNANARAWFAGNSMNGAVPADPWSLVRYKGVAPNQLNAPVAVAPVAADPPARAQAAVLARAGASLVRDPVDAAVVASVRTRSGGMIDSQREVGGWPELASGTTLPDQDRDGMPDAWERAHGSDPARADPWAVRGGRGNLERYLDARAGGWGVPAR